MHKIFVKTQNVKNFISLMNSLQQNTEGIPRMALVFGEPGLGKSQTALWWAMKNDAVYIRSANLMTGKWLLEELIEELGETPYYKTSDLFKQCVKQLKEHPRIIIVDEIDYLIGEQKAMETLRDIHDKTDVPVVLVGMNKADKKLMRYRHLYDRISKKLKFEPFSQNDVKSIIAQLSEVEMTECAVKHIFYQANRLRQIIMYIDMAENICRTNGLNVIDGNTLKEFAHNEAKIVKIG